MRIHRLLLPWIHHAQKFLQENFQNTVFALYPETAGKLWAVLLYNLGMRSYCIWSWELSVFYLFVFKPARSIFTLSTLAFNTVVENSDSQKEDPSSGFFCATILSKRIIARREVLCFRFSRKISLSFDFHWSLKDLSKVRSHLLKYSCLHPC